MTVLSMEVAKIRRSLDGPAENKEKFQLESDSTALLEVSKISQDNNYYYARYIST